MEIRERLFVHFYLGDAKHNGTLAATMAGYKQAALAAHRLIRKDKIRAAIEAKLSDVAMSQAEVLARLSGRASSSAEDFVSFDKDTSPHRLPYLDLRKAQRRGKLGNIRKIKTTRTGGDNPSEITEVEIHDALPALGLLAKFHGLLEPKAESRDAPSSIEDDIEKVFGDPSPDPATGIEHPQ